MTAIKFNNNQKANEDLLPSPIATSDLSEKNFKFQKGKTMFGRYAEGVTRGGYGCLYCEFDWVYNRIEQLFGYVSGLGHWMAYSLEVVQPTGVLFPTLLLSASQMSRSRN